MSGNAGSMYLSFRSWRRGDLSWSAAGAHGAPADYSGATGARQRCRAPTARRSIVTGVKLEIGSVATPFNRQSLAKSMADCQRYYQLAQAVLGVLALRLPTLEILGESWLFSCCDARCRQQCNSRHYVLGVTQTSAACQSDTASAASFRVCYVNGCGGRISVIGRARNYRERGALTMTYTLTAHPNTIVRDEDGKLHSD